MPALLLASLVIPVCSATFPDVIGSSDSQLEQCFDQLGTVESAGRAAQLVALCVMK